jgi:acetyl-CoA C-acetyltransferase
MTKHSSDVVIVSTARTPIGKFLGGLASFSAPQLMGFVIADLLIRANVSSVAVEEALIGNVVSAGIGQAPARQAALKGGLSEEVSATSINKVCGSGLKAVMLGAGLIKAGDRKVVIAGGMESMSRAPYYLTTLRSGSKYGDQNVVDGLIYDGLWDVYHNEHMGHFADYTAVKGEVTRDDQDEFALQSHQKAVRGKSVLAKEIVPLSIKHRDGTVQMLTNDEIPREDATKASLARLKPAFDPLGSVTAGNASPLSDGAAGVVLMRRSSANNLGIAPLARITGYVTSGVAPKEIFFAPALALESLVKQLGMSTVNNFDAVEINEAFAAQVVANQRALGLQKERLNLLGGALALGHPIGASGARVLVTLLSALGESNGTKGAVALCLGGGNAVALAVERER